VSSVNQRIAQGTKELLAWEELSDFARTMSESSQDGLKTQRLRQQLSAAVHQYFRSRWPLSRPDWSMEEVARGWDRPTGNRTKAGHSLDLKAYGVPYINAAVVPGLDPSPLTYVVTQHPLPKTVAHFWAMVLAVQPVAVLMLNGACESEDDDMPRYWEPASMVVEDSTVLTLERDDGDGIFVPDGMLADCTVRPLHCRRGDLSWRGVQLSVAWFKDQSAPPPNSFVELEGLVDLILSALGDSTAAVAAAIVDERGLPIRRPCIVVHCAGGIGRAGVFVAADCAARAAALGGDISSCCPDRLVGYLRQHRSNMVQTAEQYQFLHTVLPTLTMKFRERGRNTLPLSAQAWP